MDLKLKGKRALVLGASRGIGRSIALHLAQEGADISVCARGAEGLEKIISEVEALGVKAVGKPVDIQDAEAVEEFVNWSASQLGGLNCVVSSASAMVQSMSEADWQKMLQVDIIGLATLVSSAKPFLQEAVERDGDASIVTISSVSGINASHPSAYGGIKAALIHTARGYAKTLAKSKIRVNVVSPGTIYFEDGVWGQVEKGMPEVFKDALGRNPLGRMGTPDEVAAMVAFLSSPASAFTTGANIVVDGALSS